MKGHKECKGCNIAITDCVLNPFFKQKDGKNTHHCPCKVCLIKGICNAPCIDFKIYLIEYYDYMKKDSQSYLNYIKRLQLKRKTISTKSITYMRGIPMILKYQDVRPDVGIL